MGLIRNGISQLIDQAEKNAFPAPSQNRQFGSPSYNSSVQSSKVFSSPPPYVTHDQYVHEQVSIEIPFNDPAYQPIVIPQINLQNQSNKQGRFDKAFAKVYSPELSSFGIDQLTFFNFINQLNSAFVANPNYAMASKAGNVASYAPSMIVQTIGMGFQLGSVLASTGSSISQTKNVLQRSNETIFAPRGLFAYICKTQEMLSIVQQFPDNSIPNDATTNDFFHGENIHKKVAKLDWSNVQIQQNQQKSFATNQRSDLNNRINRRKLKSDQKQMKPILYWIVILQID